MYHRLNDYTDIQIWDLVKAGDNTAFEYMYHHYADDLFRYGQRFTCNLESIEDTIQNIFIRMWERRESITIHKSVKLYLLIAFRRSILKTPHQNEVFDEFNTTLTQKEFSIPNIQDMLIEKETERELSNFLVSAINKLSKRQKEAIHLRYIDNLSYQEIAQVMNVQIPTLYNMIFRAIKLLREEFDKRGLKNSLPVLLVAAAVLKKNIVIFC